MQSISIFWMLELKLKIKKQNYNQNWVPYLNEKKPKINCLKNVKNWN